MGVSIAADDEDVRGPSVGSLGECVESSLAALVLVDDSVLALGNGEVKIKDADRRFLDLTESDGQAFPLTDTGEIIIS